jgi:hypothetical protein
VGTFHELQTRFAVRLLSLKCPPLRATVGHERTFSFLDADRYTVRARQNCSYATRRIVTRTLLEREGGPL